VWVSEGVWDVEKEGRTMAWSTCQAEGRCVRKMEPIGFVGGVVCVGEVVWFVWRDDLVCWKKRRGL
jgi:hypothetical protein